MPRAPRAAVLVVAVGAALALAGCSDPAATMPVAIPSTKGTVMPTLPSGAPDSPGSSAPAPGSATPGMHPAGAVAALVRAYELPGLTRVENPAQAVVAGCPGGPTVTRPLGPGATALAWTGPARTRVELVVLTLADVAVTTSALDPVLDATAACRAPAPAKGVTTTVSKQRRDVVDGMPLGRVDLTRTSSGGTLADYVGVVQVGNVVVSIVWTGADRTTANAQGSAVLARLATEVRGL